MKLHPLATRNMAKLAHLSLKKVSGLPEFALFANASNELDPPDFEEQGHPFVDYGEAWRYLDEHTEKHVFLAFGPMLEEDDNSLADVLILIPGERPISYNGADFYFCDSYLDNDYYQKRNIHPVPNGKFSELAEWVHFNIGTDFEDVPEDLIYRLSHDQPAIESIAINIGAKLTGREYSDGTVVWAIDAHDPNRYL